MVNLLRCEMLKLKKSYFLLIVVAGGLIMPGLMLLGRLAANEGPREWREYFGNIEMAMFLFLGTILFALVSSFVFTREYTEKTVNFLFTYPIHRMKIFFGKLIIIYIVITSIYCIQFLATLATGAFLMEDTLTSQILRSQIKANVYSLLFQFALVPIFTLLGSVYKNLIIPIVTACIFTATNLLLISSSYKEYSSFFAPGLPVLALKNTTISFTPIVIISSSIFFFFLAANFIYLTKADIHQ
ncbi:ABC transporter permease [Paenactinomyces guangxiensis]|uniref:ABC transporter permease n=1 Tax=Paenactinomyces guangxiensis TaxID=1490290 RepID=A0A7W1WSH7_9BACL|nr:ABC transporter permease [Paenactinomyces guangxiensis]MBA4495267.1 ABC transporter permease [Paenactinomyces guangxiensis]MBH8592351.1 ABC transporter permease [Paenactinomyces guangxiensis]